MQNFIRLAAEATQTQPENQSMIILITGFVVVFMVLLLLIGLIKIYSGIVYSVQNKADSKAKAKKAAQEPSVPVETAPAIPQPANNNNDLDLQTVAVITAAVEAFYGDTKKVRIAGIRPAGSARSEWGAAGLRENIPAMRTGGLL